MADPKPLKYVDPATVDPDYEGVAQPVTIYGLETGGGGGYDEENLLVSDFIWVTTSENYLNDRLLQLDNDIAEARTEQVGADRVASLPASKITSGTFTVARIPDIAISKVTGLEARLAAIESQLSGG